MMETERFDALTTRLARGLSRRRSLGALAAVGTVTAFLPAGAAGKKKKKKCPVCPTPPTPPPAAFCAGKNNCAQDADVPCEESGPACACFLRQDNAASICGVYKNPTNTCASCPAGTVCVMAGGPCGGNFICVAPCPNPR